VIFVGVDWAEAHHDVCVLDGEGNVLGRRKIRDSFAGVGELHALVAAHLGSDDEADQVVVGIEKDRGLIVTALVAANYQVYGINPMAAAHYRDRHHVSGSKSDPGDAKMLADLVRTDRLNHRRVAGDSALINGVQEACMWSDWSGGVGIIRISKKTCSVGSDWSGGVGLVCGMKCGKCGL
jgi:hypothetical protein